MSHLNDMAIRVKMNLPFSEALERTKSAMKQEGFGVLTEIDVKETLQKKLGVDFREYVILGACNPPLAYEALQNELELGLLLPCNVIVYAIEDGSMVSIIDPQAMVEMVRTPAMESVAARARERLLRVAEALKNWQ